MSYRAPTKAPVTAWGRFLVRRRSELDWSATQAFEAVREGLHLSPKSRTAYLPFEFDREPNADEAAVFMAVFGGEPDERDVIARPLGPADDVSSLVAELRETNALLRQLVEQQARTADGQHEWGTALAQIAGLALKGRVLAGTRSASPSRLTPRT